MTPFRPVHICTYDLRHMRKFDVTLSDGTVIRLWADNGRHARLLANLGEKKNGRKAIMASEVEE